MTCRALLARRPLTGAAGLRRIVAASSTPDGVHRFIRWMPREVDFFDASRALKRMYQSMHEKENEMDSVANMARMVAGVPFDEWPRASLYDFTDRFGCIPSRKQWEAFELIEEEGYRFIVFDARGEGIVVVRPDGNGGQIRARITTDGGITIHA